MYGIYANIGGILMVNVTIYGIHGSYGNIYNIVHRYMVIDSTGIKSTPKGSVGLTHGKGPHIPT